MQCDKGSVFKAKRFKKKETAIRRNKCPFMIIATQDNKIKSQFLIITDTKHNYLLSLPGAYPMYW